MSEVTDTLHRIPGPDGEFILAWGCGCGKPPKGTMALVEWKEPSSTGVSHSYCHADCLKEVEK